MLALLLKACDTQAFASRRAAFTRAIAALVLAGLAACATADRDPRTSTAPATPLGFGHDPGYAAGFVATSSPEASAAAAAVLEAGGNAIDAAVTAQFALSVVEPQSSGIGGGGFMLVYLAAQDTTLALDFRERAPAAATADMFLDAAGRAYPFATASTSGLAVGVPGTVRGMQTALSLWGTRPLAEAIAPAIDLAERGIVVRRRMAREIAEEFRPGGRLASEPGDPAYDAARQVLAPGGQPLSIGSVLRQPALAATLRLIADAGTAAVYDCAHPGGLARAIVATQGATRAVLGAAGRGRMTCADLATYQVDVRTPAVGHYRGYGIRSVPLPSSGGLTILQMLGILEAFPIGDASAGFGFGALRSLTAMQEAMRLAYADRSVWMGDPEHSPNLPIHGLVAPAYIDQRARSCGGNVVADAADARYCVRSDARLPVVKPGDPRPFDGGSVPGGAVPSTDMAETGGYDTTHLTIADKWGNVVALTSTVEATWGTGLMVPGYGVLLNNELTDFNFVPQRRGIAEDADYNPGANDVAPGKRPRSSMTPIFVFAPGDASGPPIAAYGSPGGAGIIDTVLNVTLNLIDYRLPADQAVARPRMSLTSPADDAPTAYEKGFAPHVLAGLRELGYRLGGPQGGIGAVEIVARDPQTGRYFGAADPRRDGLAIGLPRRVDATGGQP